MPHIPPKEHKKKIRGIDIFNGRVNCWNCLQPFVISIMPIVNGLKMVTAGKRAVAIFCNYCKQNYVSAEPCYCFKTVHNTFIKHLEGKFYMRVWTLRNCDFIIFRSGDKSVNKNHKIQEC